MKPVHSLIVLFGIVIAGIAMFACAVLVQITLMPHISSLALLWYYIIWIGVYTALIIKIALRAFRRP